MSSEAISSPGLVVGQGTAYELKLHLPDELVGEVEAWAWQHLLPDPHGVAGRYRTTSVYCDTPRFDVFRRSQGYRRSKYRLRRYGESPSIYLERKTRRGDRVEKKRNVIEPGELAQLSLPELPTPWSGDWFHRKVRFLELGPACRVVYDRTAFLGGTQEQPLRLTMDRNLIGAPMDRWQVEAPTDGKRLLERGVVLELKFRDALPPLFRDLLAMLPPDLGRVSKYRLCVRAWGLVGEEV